MVDPVGPVRVFFLNFWELLPSPFRYLVMLSIGLFVISVVVHQVFR